MIALGEPLPVAQHPTSIENFGRVTGDVIIGVLKIGGEVNNWAVREASRCQHPMIKPIFDNAARYKEEMIQCCFWASTLCNVWKSLTFSVVGTAIGVIASTRGITGLQSLKRAKLFKDLDGQIVMIALATINIYLGDKFFKTMILELLSGIFLGNIICNAGKESLLGQIADSVYKRCTAIFENFQNNPPPPPYDAE